LVMTITSMGRNAEFHPTMVVPGKKLPERFVYNSFGFLVCTKI
jgi:hypothetical protein